LISREKMLALYASMVRYRKIAEATGRRTEAMGNGFGTADSIGWEATLAGVTADLVAGDRLSATPSSALRTVVSALLEQEPTLGGAAAAEKFDDDGFECAYRAARAFKTARNGKIAVHLSVASADLEGWSECLLKSARHGLPFLIVSHGELSDRGKEPGRGKGSPGRSSKPAAQVHGIPFIVVDANDVLAMYRVASESIFRARHGRGPTLIECIVAPPPAGTRGRTKDHEIPGSLDPILSMESFLTRKRILTKAVKGKIDSVLYGETDHFTGVRLQ
jgi:Dehydrogenase E1 component